MVNSPASNKKLSVSFVPLWLIYMTTPNFASGARWDGRVIWCSFVSARMM